MIVKKQFAQEGDALDERMDQLVEVLAQLLEETPNPPAAADNQAGNTVIADLHSGDDRVIHVVAKK